MPFKDRESLLESNLKFRCLSCAATSDPPVGLTLDVSQSLFCGLKLAWMMSRGLSERVYDAVEYQLKVQNHP